MATGTKRFPLLVGIGAFRTLALPSACFLFLGATLQTVFLEGPDWPNGDVWRKVGHLGPVLAVVLVVSPVALLLAIGFVFRVLRDAIKTRACDLIIDSAGVRIIGGSAGGFTASWPEIHGGSVSWNEERGLEIAVAGRRLVVPRPRHERERQSLRGVADTLVATLRGHGVAGSEHRGPPGLIRCSECAAPLAPAPQADVSCPFCGTVNALPAHLVERVRGFAEVVSSRRRDELLIRALVRQPPAWVANAAAFLGGGVLLMAGVVTTLATAAFAFIDGQEAGLPRLHGVGPMWMGAALCWLALALWLLSTRHALRLLTLGFGALAPAKEGAPFGCRECAGPLPDPADDAALVNCAYCQTINVRAVDAYFHARVLKAAEQQETLEKVLGRVASRRRVASALAVVGAATIALGAVYSSSYQPLQLDRRSAVTIPFTNERDKLDAIRVEAGPDATIERVAVFGKAEVHLVGRTGDARIDVAAVGPDGHTSLFELGAPEPWLVLDAGFPGWARADAGVVTVTKEGLVRVGRDGDRHVLASVEALHDPYLGFVGASTDHVFVATRASTYGHHRMRRISAAGEAPIVQHDVKEIAVDADGRAAVTTLVDERFQIALLDDAEARHGLLLTTGEGHVRCPTWSPDGTQVAFVSESVRDPIQFSQRFGKEHLYAVELASGTLFTFTQGRSLDRTCPVWTPAGIYVAAYELDEQRSLQRTVLRVKPRGH